MKHKLAYFLCLALFTALLNFTPAAEAQTLRERIKGALIGKIDERALEVEVKSTLHYFEHGGRKRSYYLYLPEKWDKKSSLPVVFLFHGGGGGARGALYYYELETKAEEAGFMLVAPNGTGESENVLLTWNVVFGFAYAQKNNIDDNGFINALVQQLGKEYPIDEKRIFATGLSNGAIFCHFLAAQPENMFAAIAPVVGTAGGKDQNEKDLHLPPAPARPVSICIIQGLIDEHVPISGGLQKQSLGEPKYLLSASDTINFWVNANGCDEVASISYNSDLLTTVYHHGNGHDQSEVVAYVVDNLGHAWPGSTRTPRRGSDKPPQQFKANDIIWEFFKSHPRP